MRRGRSSLSGTHLSEPACTPVAWPGVANGGQIYLVRGAGAPASPPPAAAPAAAPAPEPGQAPPGLSSPFAMPPGMGGQNMAQMQQQMMQAGLKPTRLTRLC